MVCNYTDEYYDREDDRNQVRKNELDLTTRLLCDIMKEFRSEERDRDSDLCYVNEYLLKKIPDLKQWWEKHQEADRKQS